MKKNTMKKASLVGAMSFLFAAGCGDPGDGGNTGGSGGGSGGMGGSGAGGGGGGGGGGMTPTLTRIEVLPVVPIKIIIAPPVGVMNTPALYKNRAVEFKAVGYDQTGQPMTMPTGLTWDMVPTAMAMVSPKTVDVASITGMKDVFDMGGTAAPKITLKARIGMLESPALELKVSTDNTGNWRQTKPGIGDAYPVTMNGLEMVGLDGGRGGTFVDGTEVYSGKSKGVLKDNPLRIEIDGGEYTKI